jgi:hypothetical protein
MQGKANMVEVSYRLQTKVAVQEKSHLAHQRKAKRKEQVMLKLLSKENKAVMLCIKQFY